MLEKELDKVLSEALPPRRASDAPVGYKARTLARPAARPQAPAPTPKPTSPQTRGQDFASVRKSMRRPLVNLDAQIHNIDKMLNVTQKDPSQLGSTVQQIEKSFDGMFDPIKQVRSGVQQLRKAADEFGAEYVGEKPKPGLPEMTPELAKQQKRVPGLANKPGRTDMPESSAQRRKRI